jgi:hypothetical protein
MLTNQLCHPNGNFDFMVKTSVIAVKHGKFLPVLSSHKLYQQSGEFVMCDKLHQQVNKTMQ